MVPYAIKVLGAGAAAVALIVGAASLAPTKRAGIAGSRVDLTAMAKVR
jgi:hypothetical protein